jgi:cyclase
MTGEMTRAVRLGLRIGAPLATLAAVYALAAAQPAGQSPGGAPGAPAAKPATIDPPIQVAPGVWFPRHHDTPSFGSNVAWIEFADFVTVVDAAFPLGAERALASIRKTTRRKPIRYLVLTHHHGDHSMGTGVFAREGSIIIAHENAAQAFAQRSAPSYAERVQKARASSNPADLAFTRHQLAPPQITFSDRFVIDDGKGRRAEVMHFGHAHTAGDVFTFLPAEKLVLTGDACVNGPFNAMADSDTASWIQVLGKVQRLAPDIVVPGHGPVGKGDLLETQKQYFVDLRAQVGGLIKQGKTADQMAALIDLPRWRQWTGQTQIRPENIAHVFRELSGR